MTTVFLSALKPTTATSSPTFTIPRSIRPVATVPRPVIEKTSSTGMRNGLSFSRTGSRDVRVERVYSSSIFCRLTPGRRRLAPSAPIPG